MQLSCARRAMPAVAAGVWGQPPATAASGHSAAADDADGRQLCAALTSAGSRLTGS